jgi:hypothetical protein
MPEFAGVQATSRAVRVPYSVIYDLRGDQISARGKIETTVKAARARTPVAG